MPGQDPHNLQVVPAFSQQVERERRFSLGLQPVDDQNVHVVSGGWESCLPGYVMRRTGITALAIEFVAAGTGDLTMGGQDYELAPGTIFTYGPGVAHRIAGRGDERLSKYFVNTFGKAAENALLAAQLPLSTVLRVNDVARVSALFDLLIDAGSRQSQHSPGICGHLYQALLLAILEHGIGYGNEDLTGFATFQRCQQFITENHATVTTLEEVALRCDVSSAYLCRLFQAYAHQTPYQYLTRLKMQRAAEMLERHMKAKDVAKELGFADQFHFSRTFSRVFGVSPRSFVKLAKPKAN